MKLTVLGNEGPFPSAGGATSGYLLQTKENLICLDMGSGAFSRLRAFIDPLAVSAVILSHLHFDHCSDLGVFNYYLENCARRGIFQGKKPCYLPNVSDRELSALQGHFPYFEFVRVTEGEREIFSLPFAFYRMSHPVLTYGLRVKEGEGTFVYTGDTGECENLHALVAGATFVLGDGLFLREQEGENKPHLSAFRLCELAKTYGFTALVSHLSPLTARAAYQREMLGENFLAEPMKTYEF